MLLSIEITLQAAEPGQFVGVFLRLQARSIRYIEVEHANAIQQCADHALLCAELVRFRIIRELPNKAAAHILQGLAADQGDAVVGLLAMDVHVPTSRFEGFQREQGVIHLGFLQTEQIRLLALQPAEHLIQSRADRVHVPGGDLHG